MLEVDDKTGLCGNLQQHAVFILTRDRKANAMPARGRRPYISSSAILFLGKGGGEGDERQTRQERGLGPRVSLVNHGSFQLEADWRWVSDGTGQKR